jgi:hypothetical protein
VGPLFVQFNDVNFVAKTNESVISLMLQATFTDTNIAKARSISAAMTSAKCIGMGKCRAHGPTLHSLRMCKNGTPVNSSVKASAVGRAANRIENAALIEYEMFHRLGQGHAI